MKLPLEIGREFIRRTRYRVVADRNQADAVLEGTVREYSSYPTVFDAATGRAFGVQLNVVLDIRLVETKTGNVLLNRSGMQVQGRYEITTDQAAYFDESDTALDRLSSEVAKSVVSAVLESF